MGCKSSKSKDLKSKDNTQKEEEVKKLTPEEIETNRITDELNKVSAKKKLSIYILIFDSF